MRLTEALVALRVMSAGLEDELASLAKLLPLLASPADAVALVRLKLGGGKHTVSVSRLYRLKTLVGPVYGPLLGQPNGYFHLNLRRERDRQCLRMLLQRSNAAEGRCLLRLPLWLPCLPHRQTQGAGAGRGGAEGGLGLLQERGAHAQG